MNKGLIISFVVVVVVVAAWVSMRGGDKVAGPVPTPTPTLSSTPSAMPITSPAPGASPTKTPTPTPVPTQPSNTITYTNSGYSPATITIKKGQTVTWKNNGSSGMWTASAIHPTHSIYPTSGGCLGSTFDACMGIASGGMWSFKFDIAGTWKYHNHLNSAHYGTVVVE